MTAPRTVFIELTSHCNMHCEFCPSDLLRRPKGTIDDATVRRFLDGLHATGARPPVMLNVLGEPLLNKRVFEYLDLLERDGHPVTLITNMTQLAAPAVRRELLRHANLTLALSLQTATRESFRLRGYPRLGVDDLIDLAYATAEDKFRYGSGTRLEIHVASTWVLHHDPSIQSDYPLDLWPNFPDEKSERRWIGKTLRRLQSFGRTMRRRYPEAYAAERARARSLYAAQIGTRIATTRAMLPPDFHRLKEDAFWGYMPLPNAFLVFKSFELWTREEAFLRRSLPAGAFVFIEENPGPQGCVMADSLGVLADGRYVLCCLDYEGDMNLGRVGDLDVGAVLAGEHRARIRADAMTEPLCRRCKGCLLVFETTPVNAAEQAVDKFGRGWWPYQPAVPGTTSQWTGDRSNAYVLVRIPASRLDVDYSPGFGAPGPATVRLESYEPEARTFTTEATVDLPGAPGERRTVQIDFPFDLGRMYRVKFDSPTFVPAEQFGGDDTRRLGVAVLDLRLRA
ncbi:MAG TPA: radical SAM protein [Vicinamibacterales bacterium]|jgi:hypothetical protein